MSKPRQRLVLASILSCALITLIAAFPYGGMADEAERSEYTHGNYSGSDGNVEFNADVYGYPDGGTASILRCTLLPFGDEREQNAIDILQPLILPDIDENKIILVQKQDGTLYEDATYTIGHHYDEVGWNEEETPLYSFYDGCVIAGNEQQSPYETITAASTASMDYSAIMWECGDLPFAARDEIIERTANLMGKLGISTEKTPAVMLAYSMDEALIAKGKALPYREFFINGRDAMEPYREQAEVYGGDLYQLYYGLEYNGIPTSVYSRYFSAVDAELPLPSIQAWYNKNGLIYFKAQCLYDVMEEFTPVKIVSAEEAAQSVAEQLNSILLPEPRKCAQIRLEYFAMPYAGFREGIDADLTPMWTFYFLDGNAPIVVNAITNEVMC